MIDAALAIVAWLIAGVLAVVEAVLTLRRIEFFLGRDVLREDASYNHDEPSNKGWLTGVALAIMGGPLSLLTLGFAHHWLTNAIIMRLWDDGLIDQDERRRLIRHFGPHP